mmetsp:Transcript_15241/g.30355  ORF Transcript_15241/g.30355 Transcript_15241/m.30355 type:complete len:337 (-) Transcript_15241:42-1052(-)
MSMDEPPSKRARPSSPPSSSSSAPPAPAWTPPILTPANLPHPNLLLSGHDSSVYSTSFSPSGTVLATASFDKTVLLWSLTGKFSSYNTLLGFKNAVTQCAFLEEGVLATGSADKCVRVHDTDEAKTLRTWKTTSIVNSVSGSGNVLLSGGDDRFLTLYDTRVKAPVDKYACDLQVTCVALSGDGSGAFSGGLDNEVVYRDLRKAGAEVFALVGHRDTITGLAVSPDGKSLLTNSMDETLKQWDVQPFCPGSRLTRTFRGHKHNAEKRLLRCSFSPSGSMVSCGSSDSVVRVWDVDTAEELYALPGHNGAVVDVQFSPTMPLLASASADRTVILGEL